MNIQFFHAVFFQGSSDSSIADAVGIFGTLRSPLKILQLIMHPESRVDPIHHSKRLIQEFAATWKKVFDVTSILGAENFNPPKEGFLMFPLFVAIKTRSRT